MTKTRRLKKNKDIRRSGSKSKAMDIEKSSSKQIQYNVNYPLIFGYNFFSSTKKKKKNQVKGNYNLENNQNQKYYKNLIKRRKARK